MDKEPSTQYVVATLISSVFALVGTWLPWARRIPTDGPVEQVLIPVTQTGFGNKPVGGLIVLFAIITPMVSMLARYRSWRPDPLLIISGVAILIVSGGSAYSFLGSLAIEPGLIGVLASGLVFAMLGIGGLLTHYSIQIQRKQPAPQGE
jgi:hypothetical protein